MRKFICFLSIALILASCSQDDYYRYHKVHNNSTHNVTFNFNGSAEALAAGAQQEYGNAHYTAITNIKADGDIYGIKIRYGFNMPNNNNDIIYTITDTPRYNLNVINSLPVSVTIKAGNFIDNNGSTELTVPANDTVNSYIYTRNPNFTIWSPKSDPSEELKPLPFPVIINYLYTEKENETTKELEDWIIVTIR